MPNLGRYAATRRVARTIYLGSAPTATAANRGIEDRRIKLGCVMPGESPAVFGDALRRLGHSGDVPIPGRTPLLVFDPAHGHEAGRGPRGAAPPRAGRGGRGAGERLRADVKATGDFVRVHPLPSSGQDVADDLDARLVVLGPQFPYSREAATAAEAAATKILTLARATRRGCSRTPWCSSRWTRRGLQDLDEALRRYLAWASIIGQKETLDLSPHQLRQAETQLASANATVDSRLPEAYQWLLVPVQDTPGAPMRMEAFG